MKMQIITSEKKTGKKKYNNILAIYIAFITTVTVTYSAITILQNL